MNICDKVVIVTGASSGIGQSTACAFAKEKAKIVIAFKKNLQGAQKTLKDITEYGGTAIVFQGDLSDENVVNQLFEKTLATFNRVDILINNAGDPGGIGFLDTDKNHWLRVFNNNFFQVVLCSKEAVKIMKKQGSGKIINTSSILGQDYVGREGAIAYSSAKAAVISFTKTLAKQLAPEILVNAVIPGRTLTPYYDQYDEKQKKAFIEANPIKRMIKSEEIADTFVFIAKNDAMTGSTVLVDGGYSLKMGAKFS